MLNVQIEVQNAYKLVSHYSDYTCSWQNCAHIPRLLQVLTSVISHMHIQLPYWFANHSHGHLHMHLDALNICAKQFNM